MVTALVPIGVTALPVALRLAGQGIRVAASSGMGSGLLGGGLGRGALIAAVSALAGDKLIEQLIGLFGEETEAQKTSNILVAIDDALASGGILIPEPPRGYEGSIYQQRLNYFHANMNDGKLWLSDFANGKNSWRWN